MGSITRTQVATKRLDRSDNSFAALAAGRMADHCDLAAHNNLVSRDCALERKCLDEKQEAERLLGEISAAVAGLNKPQLNGIIESGRCSTVVFQRENGELEAIMIARGGVQNHPFPGIPFGNRVISFDIVSKAAPCARALEGHRPGDEVIGPGNARLTVLQTNQYWT